MVYESSTRRIYSSASPRPVISSSYSYSPVGPIPIVTKLHRQPHLVLAYTPGISKGHIINPIAIPRVAHKRLVSVSPPPRRSLNGQNYYDMLESGIMGGYGGNRIVLVSYRPTPPPVPQSKVLYIEDVTDHRHNGSRLLRRELSPTPSLYGYGSPWEITSPAAMVPIPRPMFSLHNVPLRDTSQGQLLIPSVVPYNIRWSASEVKEIADLRRLYVRDRNPDVGYSPLNKALLYRMPSPCYVDPSIPKSYYMGRGNLACLSFAGGRPISKRRRFYPEYDHYEDKIRDEVIFRSFYTKLRDAASAGRNAGKRPVYQPIYYSRKTILGEENIPKREHKESKWVERALANEKPYVPRVKPSSTKQPVATEIIVAPPRKESLKMEPKPAAPPSVQPINVTLPGPRKSITEIIRDDLPRVENLPEESITVKMPPPAEEEPSPPPPREPTPPPPKEPTPPPPKEPTPPPPREPTPPPPKEPTPPPPKEPTPPPKEPTPPPVEQPKEEAPPTPATEETPAPVEEVSTPAVEPPLEEAPPAPVPAEEAPVAASEAPEVEAAPSTTPAAEEAPAPVEEAPAPSSEPASEVSAPAAPSDPATGDDASNKGEVEDIQLDEEITLDEVCDVEENDLEIESDDPETSQSVATADQMPQVESPQETEGSANASEEPAATETAAPTEDTAKAPENDQDAVSATPVSIVIADIDGPIPPPDEEPTAGQENMTVEQIQAEAERRRAEFGELLDELEDAVTTVTKLERVAVIVSRSCAEALAQQEEEEKQPPSSTDSPKSK